jgi:hypothetical protein
MKVRHYITTLILVLCITSLVSALTPAQETDLIAVYTFEESSGDLVDVLTGAYNMSNLGADYQVVGTNGYGWDFELDDSDRATSGIVWNGTSITITAWIKPESLGSNMWIYERGQIDTAQAYGFRLNATGSLWCISRDDGSDWVTTGIDAPLETGKWYFVAGRFEEGEGCQVYVNETASDFASTVAGYSLAPPYNHSIGSAGTTTTEEFDGVIDELYIWGANKTQDFILEIYNNGLGAFYGTTPSASLGTPVYNSTTYETSSETFSINVSYNVSVWDVVDCGLESNCIYAVPTFWYNNTEYDRYDITIDDDLNGSANFSITLEIPEVDGTTSINFNWSVNFRNLTDELDLNSSNYNQLVYEFQDIEVATSCSAGLSPSVRYDLLDEVNLTAIYGEVAYNFQYGFNNNSEFATYGNLSNVTTFYLCINSSQPTYNLSYGEIQYTSDGFVDRRNYLFENTRATNTTLNVSLYNLLSTLQSSFQLQVESTSLDPYDERYTSLLRWYPELDEYRVVEMGLTDETGSTIIHVEAEDVDYRIGVYEQDGTLIKLAEPIRMVCLVSPCTYTLTISPTDTDYTSFLDIEYTFEYNTTTGIWTFTYNDPSQYTELMNLTIWRQTPTAEYIICSDTSTAYTDILSCNTSLYTSGTLKAEVDRSSSPAITLVQKLVTLGSSAFRNTWGLFLTAIIAIPLILFFSMVSPLAVLVAGVVSLIPALYFGIVNIGIIGGLAVLAGIVAHFFKKL